MALGALEAKRIGRNAAALIGAAGIILEAVRIQRDPARELVRSSVDLIRSTLERHVYDASSRHRFGDGAPFQRQIQGRGLADVQRKVILRDLLEPLSFGNQTVAPGL